MYKYPNSTIFANVVAKFAIPQIISVFESLDTIAEISIITIVINVFVSWSYVCAFAVVFMFSLPLKYPLYTDITATKNTDGANAIIESSVSGIPKKSIAIFLENATKTKLPIIPMIENSANAILKILYAPL